MRFVELFAGIGGFSLGFERAGMECVGHVEINPYAQKVLLKHWPEVPLYPDVRKIRGYEFGKVNVICGGFPCQDISVAGKKKGIEGERSSLFHEIIRIASVCNPDFIVLENVRNLLSKNAWMEIVLREISKIGYDAEWQVISAGTNRNVRFPSPSVGAPHPRERTWIVAYPNNKRLQRHGGYKECSRKFFTWKSSRANEEKWLSESGILRVSHGVPHRVDRLKCLGNALVPQIAEYIGTQILESNLV